MTVRTRTRPPSTARHGARACRHCKASGETPAHPDCMADTHRPVARCTCSGGADSDVLTAPPSAERLFTLDEVSDRLTLGKTKTYELLKSGQLRARYIGRRRVVAAVDLEAFIANLPEVPTP